MAVQDLANFSEFDEYLNKVTGQPAVLARIGYRLDIYNTDIPYYYRGKDEGWLFTLGDYPQAEVKLLLGDIDPTATFDVTLGRIVMTQVGISVAVPAASVQTMQTGVFT